MTRLERLRHEIEAARQAMDEKIGNNFKLEEVYRDSVKLDVLIEEYMAEAEAEASA